MKSSTATFALALTAATGAAGIAHASSNPFALSPLSQGYMVAAADKTQDGKCGEGKCAANKKAKASDEKSAVQEKAKTKDGKCGTGKCGAKK